MAFRLHVGGKKFSFGDLPKDTQAVIKNRLLDKYDELKVASSIKIDGKSANDFIAAGAQPVQPKPIIRSQKEVLEEEFAKLVDGNFVQLREWAKARLDVTDSSKVRLVEEIKIKLAKLN